MCIGPTLRRASGYADARTNVPTRFVLSTLAGEIDVSLLERRESLARLSLHFYILLRRWIQMSLTSTDQKFPNECVLFSTRK
jgi:hypothetical protein